MRQVTKQEFFATLYARTQDIMPSIRRGRSHNGGFVSDWKDQHTGALFGVTDSDGAKYHFLPESKRYFLA